MRYKVENGFTSSIKKFYVKGKKNYVREIEWIQTVCLFLNEITPRKLRNENLHQINKNLQTFNRRMGYQLWYRFHKEVRFQWHSTKSQGLR